MERPKPPHGSGASSVRSTEVHDGELAYVLIAVRCYDVEEVHAAGNELVIAIPQVPHGPATARDVIVTNDVHQGAGQWVDPERASTGEMVYDLIVALGTEISPDAAYCLYTAVVSDTGSFMYSSTTADTFRVVSELVALGVKPAEVAGKLFENFTVNRLQLLQLVLDSLEMHSDGRIAIISATREMFAKTRAVPADT